MALERLNKQLETGNMGSYCFVAMVTHKAPEEKRANVFSVLCIEGVGLNLQH